MREKSQKSASNVSANISKNLLTLQKNSGKTRKKVCEDLQISYYTWGDWISQRSTPSIETIGQISDYFGVPVSIILEDAERSNAPVSIPVWNACDCITYKGMNGYISEGNGHIYISQSDVVSKRLIAYKVDVGAIPPEIEVGDTVIIELCDSVPNGALGLFITGHSCTMCRYIEKENSGVIVLYGCEKPVIIVDDNPSLDVVGKIIEVRKRKL